MKRVMKRSISLLLAVLLVLSGVVSDPASVHGAVKKPKKLELNMKSTGVSEGCQVKLKVKSVKPAKASKQVVWSSSNKKIAQVSKSGVVKGKKAGTVTITAKSRVNKRVTAKCKVKVYKATKKIKLTSKKSYKLSVGKKVKLSAKVTSPKKGAQPIQWSSQNRKVAKVDTKGRVTALSPGTTNITGKSGKKSVKVKVTVQKKSQADTSEPDSETPAPTPGPTPSPEPMPEPAPKGGTRAEWISALVDKMGYEVNEGNFVKDEETGAVLYSFDDVDNSSYAGKIETAAVYGIVPLNTEENAGQMFYPEGAVTREFAAVTAVRALGMVCEKSLSCSDSGGLLYSKEDAEAVSLGMFGLKDNKFCPGDNVTEAEWNKVLSVIDSILEGRKIDPNHVDVLDYTEAVVEEAEGITEYTVEQGNGNIYVTLPNAGNLPDLQPGDILPLPETEEIPSGIAIKVAGVVETEAGLLVTGTIPDVMEVYDHVNIEGISQAVEVIPAEGVTLETQGVSAVSEEQRLSMRYAGRKGSGGIQSIPLGYSVKCSVKDIPELAGEFEIPELKYKFDWNSRGVNEVYLEVPNVTMLSLDGSIEALDKEIKLFEIPFELPAGFSVNVVFYGILSVEGTVKIGYTFDNSFGVHYKNGSLSKICKMEKYGSAELSVTGKAGVGIKVELSWMDKARKVLTGDDPDPLYSAAVQIGIAAKVERTAGNETSLKCMNIYLYLYMDIILGEDTLLEKLCLELSQSFSIFDEESSPLKITLHFEGVKPVPKCTYGKGKLSILALDAETNSGLAGATVSVSYGNVVKTRCKAGTNGAVEISLDPGNYRVSVVKDGYKAVLGNAAVEKGKTRTLTAKLQKSSSDKPSSSETSSGGGETGGGDTGSGDSGSTGGNTGSGSGNTGEETGEAEILYSGNYDGLDWTIDRNGKLVLSGEYRSYDDTIPRPWLSYKKDIKSAVVKVKAIGMTSTYGMFEECTNMTSIDLSNFDISGATDMSHMFADCSSLTELDLRSFDTSGVTSMGGMFAGCSSLTELDLRSFDTSSVTNMIGMFSDCSSLTELDLGSFDTSEVTSMRGMFYRCSSLTELDLRSFDTSGVVDMENMFYGCSSLTELDLRSFDTSGVRSMVKMFSGCSSLTELDLRSFDTSELKSMRYMFLTCSSLTELDLSSFDTSRIDRNEREGMLMRCPSLVSIKLPKKYNGTGGVEIMEGNIGVWKDDQGNRYTTWPKTEGVSITLTRVQDE